MGAADVMIDSLFGQRYDISGWTDSPPPLVSTLWEMLASAKVIEFLDLRLGLPGETDGSAAARLVRSARELVDKIIHGWPERLHLRDADGNIIRPLKDHGPAQPRAAEATSDYF